MAFKKEDISKLEGVFTVARLGLVNSSPETKQDLYNLLMLENRFIENIEVSISMKEELKKLKELKEVNTTEEGQ